MFELKETIRYSEVDQSGHLTWPALLNYFQDSTVAQSEALGVGVEYLSGNHIAWFLTSWQIVVQEMPGLGDEVLVQTWPYAWKGIYGYRNFVLKGVAGQIYAYANSIWALIDTQTGRPQRVSEEVISAYQYEPPYPMEGKEHKISIPVEYEEKEPLRVPHYFIDTNGHMNNEKYVLVAQGYLPENFSVAEVRVNYKKAAKCSELICPRVTGEKGQVIVNLADETGKPYAVVKFLSCDHSE